MEYINAIKHRRSYYGISKKSPISDEQLEKLVSEVVANTPSPFNSQSPRVVLLLNENSDKLWDIVMETLRKKVPAEKFSPTEKKVNSFKAGYGTLLYFEHVPTTEALQEQFPGYAQNFPIWAQQANGIVQYALWTALEEAGFGANVQHYNPLIDDEVKATFNIDNSWKLIAQMPFGLPTAEPGEKTFLPIKERLIVKK